MAIEPLRIIESLSSDVRIFPPNISGVNFLHPGHNLLDLKISFRYGCFLITAFVWSSRKNILAWYTNP